MGGCHSAVSVAYGWVAGTPAESPHFKYDDDAGFLDEDEELLDLDLPRGSARLTTSPGRARHRSYGSDIVVHDDHFDDDRLRMDEDYDLEDSCDEASRDSLRRPHGSSRQSPVHAALTAAAVVRATNAAVQGQRELFHEPVSTRGSAPGRTAQIGSFVSSIFRREEPQRPTSSDRSPSDTTDGSSGRQSGKALSATADLTSWIDNPNELHDVDYSYQDEEDEEDFDAFLESVRATTLNGTRSTCSTPDTMEAPPQSQPFSSVDTTKDGES